MQFQLRPMEEKDLSRVYKIEIAAHITPWNKEIIGDCLRVGYDCRVLEIQNSGYEDIIGYIIARDSYPVFHILNISVDPHYQGKGWGQLLLQNFLHSLSTQIIKEIRLEVRSSNKVAIHLYQKFGFCNSHCKPGYYQDSHGEEDALLFVKNLI